MLVNILAPWRVLANLLKPVIGKLPDEEWDEGYNLENHGIVIVETNHDCVLRITHNIS